VTSNVAGVGRVCNSAPPAVNRYQLPTAPELRQITSCTRRCCCQSTGQTDGRTDGHRTDIGPLHRSGRGMRFSDVPHASSYTGCYEVTNSPKCQSDLATGRIGAAGRPCYMVSVAFFLPVCLCLALVSGINSRLLSANHALISPILPHPVV